MSWNIDDISPIYRVSGVGDTTFREEKSEEGYFAKNPKKMVIYRR